MDKGNDYIQQELDNLEEVQNVYEKLRRIFQGEKLELNIEDRKYLKRIEINNLLMTILNIIEKE